MSSVNRIRTHPKLTTSLLYTTDATRERLDSDPEMSIYLVFCGAQEGSRTPDLRITSALLYRLSYLGGGRNVSGMDCLPGLGLSDSRSGLSVSEIPVGQGFRSQLTGGVETYRTGSDHSRDCSSRASFGFRSKASIASWISLTAFATDSG